MSTYTFFWKSESPFSNWYPSAYIYRNITFACTEQGIMYEKALLFDPTGSELQEILVTSDPYKLKKLGRRVKNFDTVIWAEKREQLVYPHLHAKFTQNHKLCLALLATKDTILVEASPYDSIWGIGYLEEKALTVPISKWGLNILGKLLTQLKSEIKTGSVSAHK